MNDDKWHKVYDAMTYKKLLKEKKTFEFIKANKKDATFADSRLEYINELLIKRDS